MAKKHRTKPPTGSHRKRNVAPQVDHVGDDGDVAKQPERQSLKARIEATIPYGWIWGLAFTITSITVIGGALGGLWHIAEENVPPLRAKREQAKIERLQAGISIAKFDETLGHPTMVSESRDGKLIEKIYKDSMYFVQAIHNQSGLVKMFSVTSCNRVFKPSFDVMRQTIVLNSSTLSSVDYRIPDYFISGATANQRFYETTHGGNPGGYKSYTVGLNDACNFDWSVIDIGVMPRVISPRVVSGEHGDYRDDSEFDVLGLVQPGSDGLHAPSRVSRDWRGEPGVAEFRRRAVINTYGETDVGADPYKIIEGFRGPNKFQVGPDRIQVRMLRDR